MKLFATGGNGPKKSAPEPSSTSTKSKGKPVKKPAAPK